MHIRCTGAICLLLMAGTIKSHANENYVFTTPSDDRWHYPFNFSPGQRSSASCFGAVSEGFSNRDGVIIIAWDTSTLIPPAEGAENYAIQSITVTMTNQAGANWATDTTVDQWFTYDLNGDGELNGDGIARGESGDTDGESDDADLGRPIELFGAGFCPFTTFEFWNEGTFYEGPDGSANLPRDPFPMTFQQDTWAEVHCEDSVRGLHNDGLEPPIESFTPQPWAVGVPVDYQPGNQETPFQVKFTIDLNFLDDAVRQYFQSQLDGGRIVLVVTSMQEAEQQGSPVNFPNFFMKEETLTPGAHPGKLEVVLDACDASLGDIDEDQDVDLGDVAIFVNVLTGVETDAGLVELSDLDQSGSADGADIAPMMDAVLNSCS